MSIKETIAWMNEALSTKNLGIGMTYYRVQAGDIRATNGKITASHPWDAGGEFLVPGVEFETVLKRLKGEIDLSVSDKSLTLKSGRFRGTIQTLPLTEWDYPGIDDAAWAPIPPDLLPILAALRPFVNDEASQQWATCVALENDYAYATNNIAIAAAPCPGLGPISALLPTWALDFVLGRQEGLCEWAWTPSFVAFRWESGAWMRSQLVVGQFPEKAAALARQAQDAQPSQAINDDFREAFETIAELADDTVAIYANRIESRCGKAEVVATAECETPEGGVSLWGAKFIAPALAAAHSWSPAVWPKPAVFKGDLISGWVVGRKA